MQENNIDIKQAVEIIAKSKTLISSAAKTALTSDNDLIEFTNEIVEQCSEEGTNQERLESIFGKDVISSILAYSKRKAVEQDYFVMNKCIEDDLTVSDNNPLIITHGKKAQGKTNLINLHLLLTPEVAQTKPTSVVTLFDYGRITIVVDDNINNTVRGTHCIVTDTKENLINWLKEFDGIWVGNGTPMMESFTLKHVNYPPTP